MTKALSIYLGSKCNMNCAYCHRESSESETGVSDKLLNYIKERKIDRIAFFGGEPTLYMDDIKKVVEANPMADFKITTNGVGIKKYLPFFYSHKFTVCISYDGNNELRGFDPFQEVIDYPNLAVSCSLYHGNTDFTAIIKKFAEKEKIVGRHLPFYPHLVHYTSKKNKAYKLTDDDYAYIFEQYKEFVSKYVLDYVNYGIMNVRYSGLFNQLKERYYACYWLGETYCVNGKILKCNANGDFFSCLYIRDQNPSELRRYIKKNYPKCVDCHVYNMCGSACIKSLDHEAECRYYYRLYSWFKWFFNSYKEKL